MHNVRSMMLATVLLFSVTFVAFAAESPAESTSEVKSATPAAKVGQAAAAASTKRMIAELGSDGVQRATMTGGEYFLDPNVLVIKVNKPVELSVIKLTGYIPHNVVVKAPEAGMDFKIDMNADKPIVIKFTPTKVGTYPIYCDKKLLFFKSHKERGMEGVIEVVE